MRKKSYLLLLVIAVVVTSCGLSKANRDSRKVLNGTWELSHIDYQNNEGYFKSLLFNDVSSKCFRGSEWFFRSNNSTGYYNIINPNDCAPGQRFIRWSIQDDANGNPNKFQFKFIDEKKKDISGGFGYVFDVRSISENQFVISADTQVDGELITVVYQFSRISL